MQQTPVRPHSLRSRLIGDRAFYATVLTIVVPIIVQNTITNFVSLLDNIMVGQVGTNEMSGVAIANQLFFVFNLFIFGATSGPGIFTAQFHGAGDVEGVRSTFRIKLIVSVVITAAALLLFFFQGENLISLYLTDTSDPAAVSATLKNGLAYLNVMLLGLIPFSLTNIYAGTLREVGETMLPMKAGIVAVLVNLFFNWLLIFGNLGFPEMGVVGAAIATVLSRYVELLIVVISTHAHHQRHPFIEGAYRSLRVPMSLVRQVVKKGLPLLINEGLWSVGVALLAQVYSMRGLSVVAAQNISSTISNLFNVVFISMGNAVAIMAGQALGANDSERAKDTVWRLIVFGLATCLVIGSLLALMSPYVPLLYNTTEEVRSLASYFLLVGALLMPMHSFMHCSYFALRSGGRTIITFLFDSAFNCGIQLPFALLLVHLTSWDIRILYPLCCGIEFLKCIIGFVLLQKGIWIRNIVENT